MQKITFILLLSLANGLLAFNAIAETNKIVKWKDSDGVTHYGDKLPSDQAGHTNTEMRNNGMIIKKNIVVDQKTEVLDQQKIREKQAQQHADKVLLASYTHAGEIDLACERNLETDQAALESLMQQQQNSLNNILRSKKIEQNLKAKHKPIPANVSQELKQSQSEIDKTNKKIEKIKQNMDATRKRYAAEKTRFIALKQVNSSEPAMTSLNMR